MMKTWKLVSMLLLAFVAGACDDEPAGEIDGGVGSAEQADVVWGYEAKTVLKNSGEVRVPLKLSRAVNSAVKITVEAEKRDVNTIAREGIDFNIPEKVVTIPAGDTVAFLKLDLLDDGKATIDREIKLRMTGVYGGGKVGELKTTSLYIVSNAFVEFEKAKWLTYESAASNETYKSTCFIPLKITGDLQKPETVEIGVIDGTAVEYQHFELKSKKIDINPGDEMVYVEVIPVDDDEINLDRVFSLTIAPIEGGNMVIGKEKSTCQVTIFSEEVMKTASFLETEITGEEGNTIEMTIVLDHAPVESENPVTVKLSPVEGEGNAESGKDYECSELSVTFNADEKEKKVKLVLKEDDELFDKNFSLKITSVSGGNRFEETPLKVSIKNNDFPYFKSAGYNSTEGSGTNSFPVCIPKALDHDVTLQVEGVDGTAIPGTNYNFKSTIVTIKAGETEGRISYDMLVEREYKQVDFLVKVTGCEGIAYDKDISTKVTIVANTGYRKWLGKCTLTYKTTSKETEVVAGNTDEEFMDNFGKRYFIAGLNGWDTWIVRLDYSSNNISIAGANTGYRFGSFNFNDGRGPLEGGFVWRTPDLQTGSFYTASCNLIQNDKMLSIADNISVAFFWYAGTNAIYNTDITDIFKITMK